MEQTSIKLLSRFFELLERIDNRLKRLEELEKQKLDDSKTPKNRLIPLCKWNEFHMWPTIGGLRHIAFNKHKNGADKFIRKSGRRLLICEQSFFEWVNDKNE